MWLIDDNDDDDHKLFMWNAEPKLQIPLVKKPYFVFCRIM